MSYQRVIYNNGGWLEIRLVPPGTLPNAYKRGILVGPPDLTDLELPEETIRELNNQLVKFDFADYSDLRGNRAQLLRIVTPFVDRKELKKLRNELLGIYQRAYYPDKFE